MKKGISKRKKITIGSIVLAAILLAGAVFVLNSRFHIFADVISPPTYGNYNSTKYAADATNFYNSIKSNISPKITIANSDFIYRQYRAGNPSAIAQINPSIADGFMGEGEIVKTTEQGYENPEYVLNRYKINNDLCVQGKSAIMDAEPDAWGNNGVNENEFNRDKLYAFSMYYISASNCTFLSWPWWEWDKAIERDIGDPVSDPKLLDDTHEVFYREYSNAIVLVRPDYLKNTEATAFTYALPTPMSVLNNDNTLSAPVSTITLTRHQGVILIKDPNCNHAKVVNQNCVLCKAVGADRLFPHIYTYGILYEHSPYPYALANDQRPPEEIAKLKALISQRFDISGTMPVYTKLNITYMSWSDHAQDRLRKLSKFYADKGRSFDNAFVYYAQNVNIDYKPKDPPYNWYDVAPQLEDKFANIIQKKNNENSEITYNSYGNVGTKNPQQTDPIEIPVCSVADDSIYIGDYWKYGQINLNISTPKAAGETVNVQYYDQNGSWKTLPLSADSTNGFSQSGKLTFESPVSWVKEDISGNSLYWVKIGCQSVGSLQLKSVTDSYNGKSWNGMSAISGEKYPLGQDGFPYIPGWNEKNDTNKDGIIDNGETPDPNASAKFRYLARAPAPYQSNRWVMNLGDPTYTQYAVQESKNSLTNKDGYVYDGLFVDNVFNYVSDLGYNAAGTRDYYVIPAQTSANSVQVPSDIDASGATDVSLKLNTFLKTVPDGSKIIFKENGIYKLSSAIQFNDRHNLVFEGNGATLKADENVKGDKREDSLFYLTGDQLSPNSNITIRNFKLIGSGPQENIQGYWEHVADFQHQHGVAIRGGRNIEVYANTVSAVWGDGFYITGGASDISIHNNHVLWAKRNGVSVCSGAKIVARDNSFDKNGYLAFDVEPNNPSEGARDVQFINNTVGETGSITNHVFFAANGDVNSVIDGITVSGNIVTAGTLSTHINFRCPGPTGTPMRRRNIVFTNNTSKVSATAPVLLFSQVDNLTVYGNVQPLNSGDLTKITDSTNIITSASGTTSVPTLSPTPGASTPPDCPISSLTANLPLKKGFNTIDSSQRLNVQDLAAKGLTVFAYNQTGDKTWGLSNSCRFYVSKIKPGLGYYVYSPQDQTVSASIVSPGLAADDFTVIRQGMNLLSNSSDQAKKLSDLTYPTIKTGQDNKCLASQVSCFESKKLSELFAPTSKRVYHKYIIIKDGNTTDASKAFEYVEVTSANINTLTIPAHKAFWIFLFE